ncbi:protein DEFECTIVE IN MERISTEM SILENCING 3 isoform X2 [Amborella trichopoda]|uniref:protein DEFECTIVE IN MERISTEM SILENCING 3 isoform X2 n=1 Tax=Amborella trichopoda TaxID=13333 RepID=UPI0009BEB9A3|nr:protein DEFECTIVE IN MERISTEM SILENCING 3 isoform X2 [Amborella trichopoda]|eukprot:XP_020527827.1 protein DEFECTIVE IN MERISTEM SILENCING 3 isoform X2 [Amborella trichopoda]
MPGFLKNALDAILPIIGQKLTSTMASKLMEKVIAWSIARSWRKIYSTWDYKLNIIKTTVHFSRINQTCKITQFFNCKVDLKSAILLMQPRARVIHSGLNKKAEANTYEQIQRQEKAVGVLSKLKYMGAFPNSVTADVLGIVATLGNLCNDNLSRLFAEYLGIETMLAIVCKTYDGVNALKKYNNDGMIDQAIGIHGHGISKARPTNGRFYVICLEDLRPYQGGTRAGDSQKKLDLVEPRLPTGDYPPGFLGFAVNMISIQSKNLSRVTANGHNLRETLFYSLFSRSQVYRTRSEMQSAIPCISEGAISLDGGMMKSNGIFILGATEKVDIRFSLTSEFIDQPINITEEMEDPRLFTWEKEIIDKDLQRQQELLQNVKITFKQKKLEFNRLTPISEP